MCVNIDEIHPMVLESNFKKSPMYLHYFCCFLHLACCPSFPTKRVCAKLEWNYNQLKMYSYDESSSCFEPVNFCKKKWFWKSQKKGKSLGTDGCLHGHKRWSENTCDISTCRPIMIRNIIPVSDIIFVN